MTALRQEALQMVEAAPEENLSVIVNFLARLHGNEARIRRRKQKSEAFATLEGLRREVPGLDYEKALAEYREGKYGAQDLR